MYCIKCGNELPNEAKFCSNCGASVIVADTSKTIIETNTTKRANKIDERIEKTKEVISEAIHEVKTSEYVQQGIDTTKKGLSGFAKAIIALVFIALSIIIFLVSGVIGGSVTHRAINALSNNNTTSNNNANTPYPLRTNTDNQNETSKNVNTNSSYDTPKTSNEPVPIVLSPRQRQLLIDKVVDPDAVEAKLNSDIKKGGKSKEKALRMYNLLLNEEEGIKNESSEPHPSPSKTYSPGPVPYEGYMYKAQINSASGKAPMRIQPSPNANIISEIGNWNVVYVIDEKDDIYSRISFGGQIGYVSKGFLKRI